MVRKTDLPEGKISHSSLVFFSFSVPLHSFLNLPVLSYLLFLIVFPFQGKKVGEFSGVPAKLYKEYRVKRQETDNMLVDLAEELATQYVDEVKGRIVSEMENLNNENQRLVDLNHELIGRVGVVEEERRVLLEQKGEADRQQKQSVENYSEVKKSLTKALETVGEL